MINDLLDALRARFGPDVYAAGYRYCRGCETRTSASARCPACDQPGVLATSPPEGWPSVERPVEAIEPRRAP